METQEGIYSNIFDTLLKRNMHHILENRLQIIQDMPRCEQCLESTTQLQVIPKEGKNSVLHRYIKRWN